MRLRTARRVKLFAKLRLVCASLSQLEFSRTNETRDPPMKRCPTCHRLESDDSLAFCRVDGSALVPESSTYNPDARTLQLNNPSVSQTAAETSTVRLSDRTTADKINESTQKVSKPSHMKVVIAGVVVLVCSLVLGSYLLFGNKKNKSFDSIAVLPFENQNRDSNMDYLADGLTSTIINNLSRISSLHVSSRNSVYRYKGKEPDLATAAKDLGVGVVLTGRILQRDDNLIIGAELVDVRGNKQLWGNQYTRRLVDLQTVEEEIARQITQALQQHLSGDEQKQLAKHYTENSQAYQLYLKGQYQLNKRTEESLTKGIEYFRQATEEDPSYALAYSGLADAYNQLGMWARLAPAESFPRAKAAAERALALDNFLAEAHAAMAFLKFQYYWDFEGAEREYQEAIKLNPRITVRDWHAYHIYIADPKRFSAATEELRIAQELDPLSQSVNFNVAALLYFNRQYDESIARVAAMHDLDPNFTLGYGMLGVIYLHKKMPDKAVEAWLKASALEGEGQSEHVLSDAYRQGGIEGYLRKHIELLQQESKEHYVSSYFIAMDYLFIGDKDRAFEWLEKAFQERSSWLVELRVDPLWDPLRSDERYNKLLQRMGYRI